MTLRSVLRALALLPALLPILDARASAQERVDVSGLPMVVGHGTVGFVVYKGPATPSSFWRCFGSLGYSSIGEVADEVHMLQAGDLSSFTIAYHVAGEAGDAGECTALVNVYANDAEDSSAPSGPPLGSFTIPDLPWSTGTNHTFTYDLPLPLAVPRDVWFGVEIVAPPGAQGSMLFASPNEAEYEEIIPQSAAPTVGSSHDLTWFGPASCTPAPGELVNNANYFGITLNHTFALRILLHVNSAHPIPNGDFETAALSPWSGAGRYGVAIAEVAGVVPPSGAYQGFADTGNLLPTSSGLLPAGRLLLELVAGRPIAALDAMTGGGQIAHGSLLTQTLTVAAGDVLSFKWNFLTNEEPGQPFKNDSAFFLANGPAPLTVHLADTFSAFAPSTSLVYASETGFQAFSASFAVGGTYTLVFGAVDRFDAADDSVLLVDAVELVSGPPTNHAPSSSANLTMAQADFLEVAPGAFVVTAGSTLVVPFTGSDADGGSLMVSLSGAPMGATIAPVSGAAPLTSTLTWAPGTWDKSGAPWTLAVTFTDPSGASSSSQVTVADVNLPPECTASHQTVESSSPAGALVTLDGAATDADDASLVYQWFVSDAGVVLDDPSSPTPTGTFPVGVTMATLTVADGRGGIDACDVLITVEDTSAPEVMVTTDKALLWPPKSAMLPVAISIVATDACSAPDTILPITVRVSSSEPDDAQGTGDGSTRGDVNGLDGFAAPVDVTGGFCYDAATGLWTGTVRLRAERGGTGHGRKYTIDVQAMDSNGNASTTSCCVVVPHDRRADVGPD